MKNVLILTGCAGFIGIHVLERLIQCQKASKDHYGHRKFDYIISIDKMGYATKYNAQHYYELCDSLDTIYNIDCDINDVTQLRGFLDLDKWTFIDDWKDTSLYILDLASESHVDNSIADPFSIYTQNASIPANLLAWIGKENWNRIVAYYHISTDEVFSELSLEEVKDPKKWFKTTNNLIPNNPYSASKAAQDCFLMSLRHTFKLPVKFIRMANQFGPRQHPEKMLPASILRVLKGETIKVYGQGLNVRQWTPVESTAMIIVDILDERIKFTDSIHIANRAGIYNNNQVVNELVSILRDKGYKTECEYIEDRKGHDLCYALHTEKEIDGYFRGRVFTKDLEKVVDFYIANKKEFIK
jgi:dTDP-glucose 4,6-dehydratase